MTRFERFKALCDSHGETVTHAMESSGLSRSLASKWRQNPDFVPNAKTLGALAAHFGISADYFLTEIAPDVPPAFDDMPEITMIARAGRKMTPQQRAEVLHYAQYLFPEAFDD